MAVRLSVAMLLLALVLCPRAGAAARVVSAAGASRGAISGTVDAFRAGLDDGRTVTWDDVPDALAEPAALPPDFYADRGLIVRASGGDQRVSMDGNTPPDPDPDRRVFADQVPGYATQFRLFSKDRLFAPFGTTTTEFTFRAPDGGAAYVSAFGLVAADVDGPGSRMVLLTPDGEGLGSIDIPASSGAGGLSFLGVSFDAGERLGTVRVVSGTAALGVPDDPPADDVVALDDVSYAGPRATPPAPVVRFSADRVDAAERDGLVRVTVTRSGDLDRVSRVRLTTAPASAVPGDDYVADPSSLKFPRGAASATAVIKLTRDPVAEPEESFGVDLSPILGAEVGEPSRTTVVIAADRTPGGATGGGPGPAAPGAAPRPVVSLAGPRRIRLRRLLRRGIRFRLTSDRAAFAELTLSRGPRAAARRTVSLAAARRRRVRFRLGRRARRTVRRVQGGLRVRVVVTDARNGARATAERKVRLLLR